MRVLKDQDVTYLREQNDILKRRIANQRKELVQLADVRAELTAEREKNKTLESDVAFLNETRVAMAVEIARLSAETSTPLSLEPTPETETAADYENYVRAFATRSPKAFCVRATAWSFGEIVRLRKKLAAGKPMCSACGKREASTSRGMCAWCDGSQGNTE